MAAVMLVLQGCLSPSPGKSYEDYFQVRNYRATKVTVEIADLSLEVEPGSGAGTGIVGCPDFGAVAKDAEGKEIARLA